MKKNFLIIKILRLIELIIGLAVPPLAFHFLTSQNYQINDIFLIIISFSILLIWQMIFVLLKQKNYPTQLYQALIYTGTTILFLISATLNSTLAFSSYSYFLNSLIVLFLLLTSGALFFKPIKKSEQKIQLKILLPLSLITLLLVINIVNPYLKFLSKLSLLNLAITSFLFILQAFNSYKSLAIYLKYGEINAKKDIEKSFLSENFLTITTILSTFMTMLYIFLTK